MQLISHPFRLTEDGTVATVLDGTDEATAEGIAVLALTRKGERDLVPTFGLTDPAFTGLAVAELTTGLADYGPDVEDVEVDTSYPDARTERATISYRNREE